jgi:hypothetical protein
MEKVNLNNITEKQWSRLAEMEIMILQRLERQEIDKMIEQARLAYRRAENKRLRLIRKFLVGTVTAKEFEQQSYNIRIDYYNNLIARRVIQSTDDNYNKIVLQGCEKITKPYVKNIIACREGKKTMEEVQADCRNKLSPLAMDYVTKIIKKERKQLWKKLQIVHGQ